MKNIAIKHLNVDHFVDVKSSSVSVQMNGYENWSLLNIWRERDAFFKKIVEINILKKEFQSA